MMIQQTRPRTVGFNAGQKDVRVTQIDDSAKVPAGATVVDPATKAYDWRPFDPVKDPLPAYTPNASPAGDATTKTGS